MFTHRVASIFQLDGKVTLFMCCTQSSSVSNLSIELNAFKTGSGSAKLEVPIIYQDSSVESQRFMLEVNADMTDG